jgi:hypothetical protein
MTRCFLWASVLLAVLALAHCRSIDGGHTVSLPTYAKPEERANGLLEQFRQLSNPRACGVHGGGNPCGEDLRQSHPEDNRYAGDSLRLMGEVCFDVGHLIVEIDDCDSYFKAIRSMNDTMKSSSGGYSIEWNEGIVVHDGHVIVDLAQSSCRDIQCGSDTVKESVEIVSHLGPFLTVAVSRCEATGGVGRLFCYFGWNSYDLRTHEQANLLDAVEEASLVTALKGAVAHQFLSSSHANELAKADNFDSIRRLLVESGRFGSGRPMGKKSLSQFALSDFDKQNRSVAVRLRYAEEGMDGEAIGESEYITLTVRPSALLWQSLQQR